MTPDGRANLAPVVEELSRFSAVTVERDMSIISVVGEELRERVGFAAEVFGILAKAGIKLEMVSYGATRINLSFLVRQSRAREAVALLHSHLFAPGGGGRCPARGPGARSGDHAPRRRSLRPGIRHEG